MNLSIIRHFYRRSYGTHGTYFGGSGGIRTHASEETGLRHHSLWRRKDVDFGLCCEKCEKLHCECKYVNVFQSYYVYLYTLQYNGDSRGSASVLTLKYKHHCTHIPLIHHRYRKTRTVNYRSIPQPLIQRRETEDLKLL